MKGYTIKFESNGVKYEHSFLCEPKDVPKMIKAFYQRNKIKKATNQVMKNINWEFWVAYSI